MNRTILRGLKVLAGFAATMLFPLHDTYGEYTKPITSILRDIAIEQHLGAQVPPDIELADEQGQPAKLGQYLGGKPTVLILAYYRCPMLCTQVLNGFLRTSQAMNLAIGHDYNVITVSFDSRETAQLAAAKKAQYVSKYRREGGAAGWRFLTGAQSSIDRLTETVGFRYRYDPASDQFAHASGIMVLTPTGKISRYFYGIDFDPRDVRLGLVESSSGRIGSPVDQLLLLCYHYDPATGRYGFAIATVLRLAGTATVLALGSFLFVMVRQERRRQRLVDATTAADYTMHTADLRGHW